MPNQLKRGTRRLSYIENKTVAKVLDVLASAKSTNVSALIREATEKYILEVDRDGSLQTLANDILDQLPEDVESRTTASLNKNTLEALAGVMKRIRK
jgi:predicted DNA-binding protein